ncbi:FKBP-type peptidylprolyl isomerase [Tritrichomonas foetus]|uniref:peptidylprolyl isomerase n=1 Tax=Tritrichomonas foetus TaxID=1144522 RepID=A0A1J4KSX9_9EUKA|nr:FKBP-type peptidylprolyl isomerase [Tritrichomonas foetus]|eukprot:OHT12589.1 FKBP-type peptidylprolyl isomerase [Tritrichomonas foetus]
MSGNPEINNQADPPASPETPTEGFQEGTPEGVETVIQAVPINQDGTVCKQILKEGSGMKPRRGQKVTVNYVGYLMNGKIFDSSYASNRPFQFQIGKNVISGWNIALVTMKVGEKSRIIINPAHAYGSQGVPPDIPPNATLVFEIELIRINK